MTEQLYTDEMITEHLENQGFIQSDYNPSSAELEQMMIEIRDHYEEVLAELRESAMGFRSLFLHNGGYSICRRDGEIIHSDERERISAVRKSLDELLGISQEDRNRRG